jgi:hypothetical protein
LFSYGNMAACDSVFAKEAMKRNIKRAVTCSTEFVAKQIRSTSAKSGFGLSRIRLVKSWGRQVC